MKFIHLSDLHLGKRVNEFSMLEDQRYILDQITELIKKERPEGVILAGDIYDKPIPPAEAVQLFDAFLTGIAGLDIPVFLVSGNHDSAERLAFGASLMKDRKVYISPVYTGKIEPVCLEDGFGKVKVWLLPFLKPATVRHALNELRRGQEGDVCTEDAAKEGGTVGMEQHGDIEILTFQQAVAAAIGQMEVDTTQRNVLVAHQFVTGAVRYESEEVTVGGLDNVDASVFDAFDYVALGHIHSPQKIGRETVRYCGTPLKYSFSEAGQQKAVTIVELEEKGKVVVRSIPLIPLRDMRKIRGTYLEVTARSFYENTNTSDYLQVTLTDEEDVPDGMQKLRILYPNLMRLEYDNCRTRESRRVEAADGMEEKSGAELFEAFYELQNNQPMSDAQREFVKKLIEELSEKS